MQLAKYKACICEGAAETAIIDILLDNHLLIFKREEMLDEKVLHCRNGKTFEERYLRKGFQIKFLLSVFWIQGGRILNLVRHTNTK